MKLRDPLLKAYCSAMLVALYIIAIGSYPQQATQMPNGLFVYIAIAIVNRAKYFDISYKEEVKIGYNGKPLLTAKLNA